MVTDFLGLNLSYNKLVKLLGTRSFGTPFRKVQELEKVGVTVSIAHLGLKEIGEYLASGLPVLAGIHTAELSYWSQAVDHVIVIIGIDDERIYVNDPSLSEGPYPIPVVEFELAQLGFDNLCAVLQI